MLRSERASVARRHVAIVVVTLLVVAGLPALTSASSPAQAAEPQGRADICENQRGDERDCDPALGNVHGTVEWAFVGEDLVLGVTATKDGVRWDAIHVCVPGTTKSNRADCTGSSASVLSGDAYTVTEANEPIQPRGRSVSFGCSDTLRIAIPSNVVQAFENVTWTLHASRCDGGASEAFGTSIRPGPPPVYQCEPAADVAAKTATIRASTSDSTAERATFTFTSPPAETRSFDAQGDDGSFAAVVTGLTPNTAYTYSVAFATEDGNGIPGGAATGCALVTGQPLDTGMAGFGYYTGGEWEYHDFVYDDGNQANNTADIARVRLTPQADDLDVEVTLNSLFTETSTVIGIALAAPDTVELRQWPAGAGVESPWDSFVTVGTSAVLTNADGTTEILDPPAVDLDENTVRIRIPGAAAGVGVLRMSVGAGPRSDGDVWAAEPIDLAFNHHTLETQGNNRRDGVQQSAINNGNVSAFHQDIDLVRLRDPFDVDEPVTAPGLYNRVYRSSQDLGGGYGSNPAMRGKYQPYAIWIPPTYDPEEPTPLLLMLHSLGQHHNQYNGGTYYTQMGGRNDAIVITPLALGTGEWYWDEGLVDTLDAWVNVVDHFNIDFDRTYSSGYSMGGYGTYRLATLFPDRLAAGVSWVGPPTDGIWGGTPIVDPPGLTYNQLESTAHIPFYIVHGTNDELVPVTGVTMQAQRFHDLGHNYRYALHPGQDHFTFAIIGNWAREADYIHGRTRVADPAFVSFVLRPATWSSRTGAAHEAIINHIDALTERLGTRRDAAYWISGISARGTGDVSARISLLSHGIANRVPEIEEITTVGAGPPGYGSTLGPSPHLLRGIDRTWSEAPLENVLSGTLTGVSELTVDLARVGLSLDGLDLQVEVDGPTVIHLVEGQQRQTIELE